MKNMRKLIPAFAMLLVSAVMLSTASFAWFSMGSTVVAEGMSVNAIAGGSLLIAQNWNGSWGTSTNLNNQNTAGTTTLSPITWDGTNYKLPVEGAEIDGDTGVASAESGEALEVVTTNPGGTYFKDYVIYLASDAEYTASKLEAFVTFTGLNSSKAEKTLYATSVGFYIASTNATSAETAITTPDWNLTLVDYVTASEFMAAGGTNAVTANLDTDGLTIPQTTTAGDKTAASIPVVIRVYFDGELENTADQDANDAKYVNSAKIDTSNIGIKVSFDAPAAGGAA